MYSEENDRLTSKHIELLVALEYRLQCNLHSCLIPPLSFAEIGLELLSILCTSLFTTGTHPLSIYFELTGPAAPTDFHPIPKMLLDL